VSQLAIHVEQLGKRYRLGALHSGSGKKLMRQLMGKGKVLHDEDFWALRDVNLELPVGGTLGIVGGNGAGKSTLLKVLSRITTPTTGRALVRGRMASLLEVGTGFHAELTGRENVFLNGTILGMRKAEVARKFDEIVEFAGVRKFIDTPVKRYSSGMYVRLAFAVAAHLEPDVLIVDEVLAVGDAAFQQKCLGRMNAAAREGRTVLFVSHNMAAVRNLCQQGLWLKGGQVRANGPADAVIREYLSDVENANSDSVLPTGCLFREAADDSRAQLLQVDLLDADGAGASSVRTLADARFRIRFRVAEEFPAFSVELSLATEDGVGVVLSKSDDHGLRLQPAPGVWELECAIPALPLAAGNYSVGVMLAVPRLERLWHRTNIGKLKITEHDVYASGYPPRADKQLVVTRTDWTTVVEA
jgi:lipopolysaccharide transport system ATP-binding protein